VNYNRSIQKEQKQASEAHKNTTENRHTSASQEHRQTDKTKTQPCTPARHKTSPEKRTEKIDEATVTEESSHRWSRTSNKAEWGKKKKSRMEGTEVVNAEEWETDTFCI
jgi:hypothetical protein